MKINRLFPNGVEKPTQSFEEFVEELKVTAIADHSQPGKVRFYLHNVGVLKHGVPTEISAVGKDEQEAIRNYCLVTSGRKLVVFGEKNQQTMLDAPIFV